MSCRGHAERPRAIVLRGGHTAPRLREIGERRGGSDNAAVAQTQYQNGNHALQQRFHLCSEGKNALQNESKCQMLRLGRKRLTKRLIIASDMRVIKLSILFLLIACVTSLGQKASMSPSVKLIINSLKKGGNELDVSRLHQVDPQRIIAVEQNKDIEVYHLPANPRDIDSFLYTIYYDAPHGEFWVMRTGGIAGGPTIYGPTNIATLKK